MTEHWFRKYHGTASDPKWKVVATRASHTMSHRVTIASVVVVWDCMMDCASQATPRGELVGWDSEDIAALLEIEQAEVDAIYQAMQGKTLNGNTLINWEKRQPKREREDHGAAARKAAQRERDAAAKAHVTPESHHVTPRGEERREEKKEPKPLSVGKVEMDDSRETPADPPTPRAESMGTPAGRAAKALKAGGLTHVNPSHPALLRLIEAGVTDQEFTDAAAEAVACGKRHIAYVCAVIEGRRTEAQNAGKVPPRAGPVPGSGARRVYVPEHREIDPARQRTAEAQTMADITARLNLQPKPETTGETPTT